MTSSREALMEEAIARLGVLAAYRRRSLCNNHLMREISLPQFHALVTLQEHGALTVSELAHLLQISAPSASSIVDRMEEHRYVERERSTSDRRVVHVLVSECGRKLVEDMMGMKADALQTLLGAMTEHELRAIIAGLDALHNGLDRLTQTNATEHQTAV
jgi:DNA-binding MarR family transcriptional regulator